MNLLGSLRRNTTVVAATGNSKSTPNKTYRWIHNENAMATEKVGEGILMIYADARKLEQDSLTRVDQKPVG